MNCGNYRFVKEAYKRLKQYRKALFHQKIESNFFHLNPEILAKLFNLIYYLIFTQP